jgi:hypothetical protein
LHVLVPLRIHGHKKFLGHLGNKEYVPQYHLKTEGRRVGQIKNAVKITVPDPYRIKQNHDGDDRDCQGQGDDQEKTEIIAAVNMCSVKKPRRQAVLKIGLNDDHIVTGEHKAEDKSPPGTDEVQIPHKYIIGNQSAVEEHGNNEKNSKKFSARQIPAGQGIGRDQKQDNRDRSSPCHIKKGIEKGQSEADKFENRYISPEVEFNRPEPYLPLGDRRSGAERTGQAVDQGIEYKYAT